MGVALVLACCPALADSLAGHARLVDGDTLEVAGERVRLHGIDAPEHDQSCYRADGAAYACGAAATAALGRLISGRDVTCEGDARDRYGRLIAVCRAGGIELNREMVRLGMAVAYEKYSDDYLPEQIEAFKAARGLWAGSFERPAELRAEERAVRRLSEVKQTPPPGCPIKGNISSSGRIYHLPGTSGYEATRIDTSRGERWFCSEAEAVRAGWRAPRR